MIQTPALCIYWHRAGVFCLSGGRILNEKAAWTYGVLLFLRRSDSGTAAAAVVGLGGGTDGGMDVVVP